MGEEAVILGKAVGAWLARASATALVWRVCGGGWEEHIARALVANEGLQKLWLEMSREEMHAAPLLQALQGHARLQEVYIGSFKGIREEGLCICLVGMPSLRSFALVGLGKGNKGGVRLE